MKDEVRSSSPAVDPEPARESPSESPASDRNASVEEPPASVDPKADGQGGAFPSVAVAVADALEAEERAQGRGREPSAPGPSAEGSLAVSSSSSPPGDAESAGSSGEPKRSTPTTIPGPGDEARPRSAPPPPPSRRKSEQMAAVAPPAAPVVPPEAPVADAPPPAVGPKRAALGDGPAVEPPAEPPPEPPVSKPAAPAPAAVESARAAAPPHDDDPEVPVDTDEDDPEVPIETEEDPERGSIPPVELKRVLPSRPGAEASEPPQRISSLPPALVEPNRIIDILGSSGPSFEDDWSDDVEDLDESEAQELSETPLPDSAPTFEVEIEIEAEGPPKSLRSKAPPKKRRQRPPSPPSARSEKPPVKKRAARRPWWEEMFSQEFLRAIPILLPRQLVREADFIERSLGVVKGGRLLDLGCGAGQHAVELASRGYEVVGFDSSQAQLDWAGELAQERGERLQFINGDMRTLTYQETFDGILCWNTSFGFFEEDKNIDVAARMFAALRPGGRLLLDVVNRDYIVAEQPGQTWFEGDGCVCIDDVTIDFITSRMRVKRTMMLTTGKNLECSYSVRLYGLHELGKILHDVGFKVVKVSGRPETPGAFFGETSPRLIILASKPGDV